MAGTPLSYLKAAAKKFCTQLLSSSGKNSIGIVIYDTGIVKVCDFTDNLETLVKTIDSMDGDGSWTNIDAAAKRAHDMLQNTNANVKNLVIMTDGLPTYGSSEASGRYNSDDIDTYYSYTEHYVYEYANALYNDVISMFKDTSVYTLGYFHNLSAYSKAFGSKLLNDIQNAGYYEVTNPDDLEFVFGEIAEEIQGETKKLTFTYESGGDHQATCYYSDSYFAKSSYNYQDSLATMSLAFAMSAFGSANSSSYTNKSQNARKLLTDIGCNPDSISVNEWYTKKPTTDSIAAIAGSKSISVKGKQYTLIAVAVRGGGYEQEWASNFTIGTSGQHQGFDEAKNNVIKFIKGYISNEGITGDVKIWITGYSRAAATANLVAGAIDKGTELSSRIKYGLEDVFAYCFETPAGAITSEVKGNSKYYNIYNIINSSDPVPYVAPAALGFGRYGIDKYLPSAEADTNYGSLKKKMLSVYESMPSTDTYVVDDFQMKKVGVYNWLPGGKKMSFVEDDNKNNYSQGTFLTNYITILAKDFMKSRSNYVASYQSQIREICSVVFGCSGKQLDKLVESIINQAKDEWPDLLWAYLNPFKSEEEALSIVSDWLVKAIKAAGITDYDENMVRSAGVYLADLVLALVVNHPNYATTLAMNIGGIGAAHYPELCFAWLASMDSNYTQNVQTSFNNGSYRIIRINCAVDVDVYDTNGTKVASITNETPQNVSNSTIISSINDSGEKIVVLPVDTTYQITITARENDNVDYGIDEYCALAGDYTRAINYFSIPLSKAEKLSGVVPAYSAGEIENDTPQGSQAVYTLLGPNGEAIESDSDLSGTAATSAYYTVEARPSIEEAGIVLGSGIYQYGNYAMVSAAPNQQYEFDGWYIGNELVSSESEYRFCVTKDVNIVARFKGSGSLTILQQPKDQYVVVGQRATFTIHATGNGLTYQWYIKRNSTWKKIEGANTSSYTTAETELSNDGYQYGCLVTDNIGNSVKSDVATLHVSEKPDYPDTGDHSTPLLWLGMIIAGVVGIMLLHRKQAQNESE